ncbi:MAG TPA: SRPBCC family protein [Solirubrobacteraceae bacterium]|nr:SRPBCC family protein [Solirubrobacteraceae bacterium]
MQREVLIRAAPERVWAVLADPYAYPNWVPGSGDVRAADDDWPQPGARFHHTAGVPGLRRPDSTRVIEADPPRRLVLEVRARPWNVADVDLRLEREGKYTRVALRETAEGGLLGLVANPGLHALIALRNGFSLDRLRQTVEQRAGASGR